jgi:hypothetical protein
MRSIKTSMESAFNPAPLWRLAWRMVVQMLPGRAYGWEGGGGGGWFWVGDWLGVEFVDNVDVGVVDGGNRGGGSCSCDGSAELV